MSKRLFIVLSLSLAAILAAGITLGASNKVFLSPKPLAGPSDAIPIKGGESHFPNTLGADYWIYYDTGAEANYLGGLHLGDTMLVWFESPARCTLLEVHFLMHTAGDFDMFAADAPDTIDFLNDYEEYHGGSNPGPRPIDVLFEDSVGLYNDGHNWQVLEMGSPPDVGTDIFVGGYVLLSDGAPLPIIDAGIDPPYHTLMERPVGGGPRGWYSSWHHVYIRALVSIYENAYPTIESHTKLPDTYSLNARYVTAHITDIGVPAESVGVDEARILYGVNGGPEDTLSMFLVSGTIEDGTWAGFLPSATANDTVEYSISAVDLQGAESVTAPWTYVIRVGRSTAELLFVNDDYYGFNGHDPVDAVVPDSVYDFWEADQYGLPDSSVIHFGYKAILWNTWDGSGDYSFVADTLRVAEFLNDGGYLWVSSQDLPAGGFGYSWGSYATQPGEFCHDYLHLMGGVDDYAVDTISTYYGVPGDPISGAFAGWPIISYPYSWVGPGYNYAGSCEIDSTDLNASGIFYDLSSEMSGYKYSLPGGHKIVFLYWPFNDLVNLDGTVDTTSQDVLVARILAWFGIGSVGVEERLKERLSSESKMYLLWQNWPNPARGQTAISFNVPEPTHATVSIYDVAGRMVSTLLDDHVSAGRHSVNWDGRDQSGKEVPSGIYIYRLTAGNHNLARKLVLVR
ncbi:T9SS type A sorting domain-containing protein [candidate division TA06 bacterium]|uniref:T9SS type A sorting domain-containing protein n=1 Tax=candidate division TA06 bacterium TaxID=2250710 RepID=A0A523UQZ7_UNCT6|nr:MAG: T9SS type A sorting domain-containing protein [candidate division TA06 bacterium]